MTSYVTAVRAHRPFEPQPAAVFSIANRVGSPRRKAVFLSMRWMLLLVLVVIGVRTLMGTTASPVM